MVQLLSAATAGSGASARPAGNSEPTADVTARNKYSGLTWATCLGYCGERPGSLAPCPLSSSGTYPPPPQAQLPGLGLARLSRSLSFLTCTAAVRWISSALQKGKLRLRIETARVALGNPSGKRGWVRDGAQALHHKAQLGKPSPPRGGQLGHNR